MAELQELKTNNQEKIADIESQRLLLQNDDTTKIANLQPIIDGFHGLMARITALDSIPWLPSFFIFLLFLAIETSRIFAKLVAPNSTYDYKLEDSETAVKIWVAQKVNACKVLLKSDIAINNNIYNAIAEEEEEEEDQIININAEKLENSCS